MENFIDWEEESYPQYEDFIVLPLFALFFPTVRYFLDKFLFEKVARRLIFGKRKLVLENETDRRRKRLRKFKESAWKFRSKLKALYMYAGGFYAYSLFALIFWETRRSDFGVSMSHHVATAVLIVLSYIFRFARVGSVVLALHDASDIFLEIGKMSKYSGAEGLASFSFVLFALSWIVLRLTYFPFWVLWSTSYEVIQTLDKEKHKVEGPIYYYVFNSLLYCLLVLHIYWWVLIYRMLVKQIQFRGQLSEDVRSDSEEEDGHEH
ncbi:ASC1-like protein isoform X3 [Nicotiana tomentosiformis]|uniref:ASC1-like protein isoform X3 n=1 Tax=Nicotiana tomentosiformis TaxID=4098 RepID=UPI00051B35E6|nr:ASC1-like protein isoform X3 [Nicotiana tomentosiformis]